MGSDEGTTTERMARFQESVELASARYMEAPDWSAVVELALGLSDEALVVGPALAETLALELAGGGIDIDAFRVPDVASPVAVADAAVGLVRGALGVAETGSVLLVEPTLEERVVSMLCHTLVQGIARELIVESLEDFASWMQTHVGESPYATLTTGPSRTADIERSLTIGVQGPTEVVVVVVG